MKRGIESQIKKLDPGNVSHRQALRSALKNKKQADTIEPQQRPVPVPSAGGTRQSRRVERKKK